MRLTKFFYLALLCVVVTWSACDDEDMQGCEFEIPFLPITKGDQCTPALLTINELDQEPVDIGPSLPLGCTNANDLGRQISLDLPTGNRMELHIYSGIRGTVHLQVFGATDCDQSITPVTGCFSITDVADIIELNGLSAFDNLYVRVDFTEPDGSPLVAEADDFVGLAAYERSPRGTEVEYVGTSNGELQQIVRACDGLNWQRIILTACDPGKDVDAWAAETGLENSERYGGNGGTIVALEVPPGLDPNTVGPAVARRRLERNDDDYTVESDHIIFAPGESAPGVLADAGDILGQELGALQSCLVYEVNTNFPTENDPESSIVVTMIDSGVELGGNWNDDWENHLNRAYEDLFINPGDIGFDFFYGDLVPDDELGHGTNTAGALIGNYRGDGAMTVIHHKIFGAGGEATYFGALVAIHSAVELRSNIINCSWGYVDDVRPRAMECAIAFATQNGALVVASAGNNSTNIASFADPQWPATFSEFFPGEVLTIAAFQYGQNSGSDIDFSNPIISPDFSNFGEPGLISVSYAAYLTAQTPRYLTSDFNFRAGTSISAPLVTSALATSLVNTGGINEFESRIRTSENFFNLIFDNRFLPACEGLDE